MARQFDILIRRAQQNISFRTAMTFILGTAVWIGAFTLVTFWETKTSPTSPPHGVSWALWDGLEDGRPVGGSLYRDDATGQELILRGSIPAEISAERWQRYLRPPFMRHRCFTGSAVGCEWTDIDLENFKDAAEWLDYAVRAGIGVLLGLLTVLLGLLHTETPAGASTLAPG